MRRCPYFFEKADKGECRLYPTGGFARNLCDLDDPTTCGDDCPGDRNTTHVVVTNSPRGVTSGVSWHAVSEHSSFDEAAREASRLSGEAHYEDDQGRSMWTGQSYRVVHPALTDGLAAGNFEPEELFEFEEEEEEDTVLNKEQLEEIGYSLRTLEFGE